MTCAETVSTYLQQDWDAIASDLSKIDSKLGEIKSNGHEYYMFQYGDKCHSLNMTPIHRSLRGAVVDKITREIVSRTYSVPVEIDASGENLSMLKDIDSKYLIKIQSLYDGTMLRLSHFDDKWHLLTNGKFSAYESIWRNSKSFGKYFDEFISNSCDFYDSLDKEFTYIFVFCHPENTIVINYKQPKLYLVSKINNKSGKEIEYDYAEVSKNIRIEQVQYHFCGIEQAIDNALNGKVNDGYIFIQTFELNQKNSSELGCVNTRYRLQSKAYSENEQVLNVRSVTPQQRSTYLYNYIVDLIRSGDRERIAVFLNTYPNHRQLFDRYWSSLQTFPQTIHTIYIQKNVKKTMTWIDGPHRHKFVAKLHDLYMNTLRHQKMVVTINTVMYLISQTPTPELVAMLGE